MHSTENIKKFLQTAYTDEKLAALLAHAQDGKLSYNSCCCFIGISSALHPLESQNLADRDLLADATRRAINMQHYISAQKDEQARAAEHEFVTLGKTDAQRRKRIIPLIIEEQVRREIESLKIVCSLCERETERLYDLDGQPKKDGMCGECLDSIRFEQSALDPASDVRFA